MLELLVTVSFFVLISLGVPIAYALLVSLASYLIFSGQGGDLVILNQQMSNTLDSFTLLAIPLFLLAGNLMTQSGMAERLTDFAKAVMGQVKGGLAQAGVVANVVMAGMSGSAVADAAATGSVFIPLLKRDGYSSGFAAAVTAAPAMIGPIFPPSIVMVVYAGLANASVGRMLLGGVIPGLMMGAFLMVGVAATARRRSFPAGPRASLRAIGRSSLDALLALLMPAIILGGLLGGIYTATEGAAIAVVYAVAVGAVIYRTLTWKRFKQALADSVVASGVVMFVIAATDAVSYVLDLEGAYEVIRESILDLDSTVMLWAAAIIIIVVGGIVLEGVALLVLLIPVLVPPLLATGADEVVVGMTIVFGAMLGSITPPVGVCMFIVCQIADCSVMEFTREIWVPLLILFGLLIAFVVFPATVTFLPNLVLGP